MACSGICLQYKATKSFEGNTRYALGQKRCNACDVFMDWEGIRCPCCRGMLRTKPRSTKGKEELRIIQQAKRI